MIEYLITVTISDERDVAHVAVGVAEATEALMKTVLLLPIPKVVPEEVETWADRPQDDMRAMLRELPKAFAGFAEETPPHLDAVLALALDVVREKLRALGVTGVRGARIGGLL